MELPEEGQFGRPHGAGPGAAYLGYPLEFAMGWNGVERRRHWRPTQVERRGLAWQGTVQSALGSLRPPDAMPLSFTESDHPARLTPSDLENPHGFRQRLVAWLMKQH